MADVATLGIQVETNGVDRGIAALNSLTNAAGKAEDAAQGIGGAFNTATSFSAAAIERMAAQMGKVTNISQKAQFAITNFGNAATKAGAAMNAGAHNVSNLAAQFQDIGVTLAMGMSPLQIALQQGTQIAAVLGPMGAMGAVKGLGAALMSVISPVSLVTIGLIAAGAAAAQYFFGINSEASNSEANLAKQEALIGRVADKWGDALPAVKAYNDEITRTRELAERAAAQDIIKEDLMKDIPARLKDATFAMNEFVNDLELAGEEEGQIIALQKAFERMKVAISEARSPTDDLNTAIGILQNGMENQFNPAVGAAIKYLQDLAAQAATTASAVAKVFPSNFPGRPEFTSANDAPDYRFNLPGTGPTPGSRPTYELDGPYSVASGGSTKQSAYDSATRSIIEQTAALKAQNAVQATLNPLVTDYGFAMAKAKATADLLAAAERDNKTITADLTNEINANATALANQTVAQNKQAEATANAKAQMEAAKGAATGFLSTLRQGLVAGEGWWASFGNAALSVLDKIASAIETQLVNALFSTTGGGFNILSLLGLGGSVVTGGLFGGAAGASGMASQAPLAKAVSSARMPSAKSASSASGVGIHVTVGAKKGPGISFEPEIIEVARTEAGKAAGAVKANFDGWRKNGFHEDWEKHARNRRKVG